MPRTSRSLHRCTYGCLIKLVCHQDSKETRTLHFEKWNRQTSYVTTKIVNNEKCAHINLKRNSLWTAQVINRKTCSSTHSKINWSIYPQLHPCYTNWKGAWLPMHKIQRSIAFNHAQHSQAGTVMNRRIGGLRRNGIRCEWTSLKRIQPLKTLARHKSPAKLCIATTRYVMMFDAFSNIPNETSPDKTHLLGWLGRAVINLLDQFVVGLYIAYPAFCMVQMRRTGSYHFRVIR